MPPVSLADIGQFKSQLADYPEALSALQALEDCDGDLADAALSLALRSNLEPDGNETWLNSFAKRFRHIICQESFRDDLQNQNIVSLVNDLTQNANCPDLLAVPVALYVLQTGVSEFCYSFDHSRIE